MSADGSMIIADQCSSMIYQAEAYDSALSQISTHVIM
jgi:hypothetical protein